MRRGREWGAGAMMVRVAARHGAACRGATRRGVGGAWARRGVAGRGVAGARRLQLLRQRE